MIIGGVRLAPTWWNATAMWNPPGSPSPADISKEGVPAVPVEELPRDRGSFGGRPQTRTFAEMTPDQYDPGYWLWLEQHPDNPGRSKSGPFAELTVLGLGLPGAGISALFGILNLGVGATASQWDTTGAHMKPGWKDYTDYDRQGADNWPY